MKEYNFENSQFTDEEFIIDGDFAVTIGVNTVLNNCSVINKLPSRGLSFINCTMKGGEFITKKQLTNWQEHHVIFDGVKFKGRFVGCDFGGRESEMEEDKFIFGNVVNCDFSEANIHMSRLYHSNIDSIIFPKWPHFTVLKPSQQLQSISNAEHHPNLNSFKSLLYTFDEEITAKIYNAEKLSKKNKVDIEEIKKFIEQIDEVIY